MQTSPLQFKRLGFILAALVLAAAISGLFLSLTTAATLPVRAADSPLHEWVLVTGISGTLNVIDTATDIVYGPFLLGQLSSEGNEILDVTVTPDGGTALISNFRENAVYFVDISNRISPSVVTSVTLPMYAEDIAISPRGQFALVTGGNLSSLIAVINLQSRTLAYTVEMGIADAQAVDIAPDGTVIVADYTGGSGSRGFVHALYPNASGQLTVTGSYSYALTTDGQISFTGSIGSLGYTGYADADSPASSVTGKMGTASLAKLTTAGAPVPKPVNVAIAPDGKTVIVCDVVSYNELPDDPRYSVGVYRIVAPGILSFTGVVTDLTRAAQSVAFNPDGTKAYLSGNNGIVDGNEPNHLMILKIAGPGQVSLEKDNAADYPRTTSTQFFGVDTLAVSNNKVYIGYPIGGWGESLGNDLQVVDLSDYSVRRFEMPSTPVGIAVIPIQTLYLPLVSANYP